MSENTDTVLYQKTESHIASEEQDGKSSRRDF